MDCLHIQDYNLFVEKNGFKADFSQCCKSQDIKIPVENTPEKKSKISSYLLLVLLFLFTNFLFAQQPACNLNGILETKRQADGGQNFTINSEVVRAVPGTIYHWEFKSNNSGATFVTEDNLPSITINPGNTSGNFSLKLTVINPARSGAEAKTCSCTKSVSIGSR